MDPASALPIELFVLILGFLRSRDLFIGLRGASGVSSAWRQECFRFLVGSLPAVPDAVAIQDWRVLIPAVLFHDLVTMLPSRIVPRERNANLLRVGGLIVERLALVADARLASRLAGLPIQAQHAAPAEKTFHTYLYDGSPTLKRQNNSASSVRLRVDGGATYMHLPSAVIDQSQPVNPFDVLIKVSVVRTKVRSDVAERNLVGRIFSLVTAKQCPWTNSETGLPLHGFRQVSRFSLVHVTTVSNAVPGEAVTSASPSQVWHGPIILA